MEAFKPKQVNSILNIIGVNSFRLGDIHIIANQSESTNFFYNVKIYLINILS